VLVGKPQRLARRLDERTIGCCRGERLREGRFSKVVPSEVERGSLYRLLSHLGRCLRALVCIKDEKVDGTSVPDGQLKYGRRGTHKKREGGGTQSCVPGRNSGAKGGAAANVRMESLFVSGREICRDQCNKEVGG